MNYRGGNGPHDRTPALAASRRREPPPRSCIVSTYPDASDTAGWRALLSAAITPEDRTRLVLARAEAAGCHLSGDGQLVIPATLPADAAVSLHAMGLLNNVPLRLSPGV